MQPARVCKERAACSVLRELYLVTAANGGLSVAEVADAGKDHSNTKLVGCLNDLGVTNRAARLNDRRGACLGHGLEAIGEREEGVGGGDRALERENGLQSAEACGVDAAHLSRTDTNRLA